MPYLLYKIVNRVNGKAYIGFTKNSLEWRIGAHTYGTNPNALIHKAIAKYGRDAFNIEEIGRAASRPEAAALERQLIILHNTFTPAGYNLTPGGEGNDAPRSDQTKERMRQARQRLLASGWKVPEEARARQAAKLRGRKRTPEQIASQRAKMIGQKRSAQQRNNMRGRKHSAETLAKIIKTRRANWRIKQQNNGQLTLL